MKAKFEPTVRKTDFAREEGKRRMSCFMSTVVNLAIVAVLIASRGKRKIRHEESIEGEIGKSHSRALSLAGVGGTNLAARRRWKMAEKSD